MEKSVFDFQTYKAFINAWILQQPSGGHGMKSVIAQRTDCNPAYVTQVLKGNADFSLEQIEKLKDLLGLGPHDFDFLLLLVEKDRAGTLSLKKYFSDKIAKALDERKQLKNRLKKEVPLTQEVQLKYFSTWVYAAVHMALTVPTLQDARAIARKLKLEEPVVNEAIQFLLQSRIITQNKAGYQMGEVRFHLPHDSELIFKHHTNWRLQALKALDQKKEANLHYSSVVSISEKDFQEIRENLLKAIESAKAKIKESPEESVVSFCLDFFKVSVDEGF